jgi:hypothetical protein
MIDKLDTMTGGLNTAEPAQEFTANAEGTLHEDRPPFDEAWHNDSKDTDPDSTTRCRSWEDVACRESYEDYTKPKTPSYKTYSFGPYGTLRATLIGDKAWCSLTDAGRIAGLPTHEITGFLYEEDEHVRGEPLYLNPDGVRLLYAQGIDGRGIRLEALAPYFRAARGGSLLEKHLIKRVIPDIYAGSDSLITWKPLRRPRAHQWRLHRFYDTWVGECRVIIIGTRAWVNAGDIGRWSILAKEVFIEIAGSSRTLTIENSDIAEAEETEGSEIYIRFDAVASVFKAMDKRYCGTEELDHWISKKILSRENQLRSGMFVRAKTLHGLLSKNLSFREWTNNIRVRGRYDLTDLNDNEGWWEQGDDFKIPLTDASDIAEKTGSRRGMIVHLLLLDGGYLHKGPVAEPAHTTLRRFKGLLPDRHDRVKARAAHEFIRDGGPFETWIKKFKKNSCAGLQELITFDEAFENGLRVDIDDYYFLF